MNFDKFWRIISRIQVQSDELKKARLKEELALLSDQDSLKFDDIWTGFVIELFTFEFLGVACLLELANGGVGCSDDRFIDWRHWLVSCGREIVEIGLNQPDHLMIFIKNEPEVQEGIGYISFDNLENRGLENTGSTLQCSLNPKGKSWEHVNELRNILPSTFEWASIKAPHIIGRE